MRSGTGRELRGIMQQFRETTRKIAARARDVIHRAIRERVGEESKIRIGWVRRTGSGRSRDIFAVQIDLDPDPDELSGVYVVLIPRYGPDEALVRRTRWEAEVLVHLARQDLPFRVPIVLGALSDGEEYVLIRGYLDGVPLDMRIGRQEGIRPWEIVGRVAAAIHRIDATSLSAGAPGWPDRIGHAREKLSSFEGLSGPEVMDALAWTRSHLPAGVPSSLVHGDLLGQNILVHPDEPLGVIDWEYCLRGDPAYDLAIVTRGVEKPFQSEDGLDRLLDAYHEAGGHPLTATEVHFYELCLAAKWYGQAIEEGEAIDLALDRLRGVLQRVA